MIIDINVLYLGRSVVTQIQKYATERGLNTQIICVSQSMETLDNKVITEKQPLTFTYFDDGVQSNPRASNSRPY
jgi:hypothetical protein